MAFPVAATIALAFQAAQQRPQGPGFQPPQFRRRRRNPFERRSPMELQEIAEDATLMGSSPIASAFLTNAAPYLQNFARGQLENFVMSLVPFRL